MRTGNITEGSVKLFASFQFKYLTKSYYEKYYILEIHEKIKLDYLVAITCSSFLYFSPYISIIQY